MGAYYHNILWFDLIKEQLHNTAVSPHGWFRPNKRIRYLDYTKMRRVHTRDGQSILSPESRKVEIIAKSTILGWQFLAFPGRLVAVDLSAGAMFWSTLIISLGRP